jgi:glycosyltransferase involved in cell wall biosynthesis
MTDPLITTIIPTYQRPHLLRRALSSALNQTVPSVQVCVYDNASFDGTSEVVMEFVKKDSRVKYHCHQENIGMLGNYQYALSQVKTTYFSFLSDDDVILPWFYEEALRGFKQFPECGFSAGSGIVMSEEGKVIRIPLDLWKEQECFSPPEGLFEMISKYPIPTCVLFHRKIIDEIAIDMDNSLTWDCDFLMQIAARYPIFISKRPCGIFLHHDSSYSNAQKFENWKCALSKMCDRLQHNTNLSTDAKNTAIARIEDDLRITNRAFILKSLFSKKFKEAYTYSLALKKNCGWNFEALFFYF